MSIELLSGSFLWDGRRSGRFNRPKLGPDKSRLLLLNGFVHFSNTKN